MSTYEDQLIERMRKKNEERQALLDQKQQEKIDRMKRSISAEKVETSSTSTTSTVTSRKLSFDELAYYIKNDFLRSSYSDWEEWKKFLFTDIVTYNNATYETFDDIYYDGVVQSMIDEYHLTIDKIANNKEYDSDRFAKLVHFINKEDNVDNDIRIEKEAYQRKQELEAKEAKTREEQQEFEKKREAIFVLWIITILIILLQIINWQWWALLSVILTLAVYACVHYLYFKENVIDFFKSDFFKKLLTSNN